MVKFITELSRLLTPEEKREMYWLLVGMLLLGCVEFVGVGSILPFMQMVSDKNAIHKNHLLESIFSIGWFADERIFLVFLGIVVLVLIIINNAYTAFINYRIFYFSWMRNASISTRLFANYLDKEYEFYLTANTSDLEKNLFDEVRLVVIGMLNPILMMTKNLITVVAVFSLLIYTDPFLAVSASLCLGSAYLGLFAFISNYLKRIGIMRAQANKGRFKMADEALKGIKELKVLNRKNYFLKHFSIYSREMSLSQAQKNVVSKLPKHAFEVIAFGGILLTIIYYLALDNELNKIIPILALYAFAGYRLMPALQTMFTGVAELRYTKPALSNLLRDLDDFRYQQSKATRFDNEADRPAEIDEFSELRVENVWYAYPDADEPVLSGLNLAIKTRSTIGLIGSTGSGKTTLVDIILGLLLPSKGRVLVNGIELSENMRDQWKARVGYVPQDIFLLDDTVAKNIAYGIDVEEINTAAVEHACKLAEIHDTIVNELDDGYNTVIGERGVKLSGGQRQRLGIARALYHDPEVLIFDEGTSALDNLTEQRLMDQIHRLAGKKTILMIAHRLTTLQSCDEIFFLAQGVVKQSGTYGDMRDRCELFLDRQDEN